MSAITSTNGVFTLRNPGNNDEIRACCIIGGTNAFETANAPGGSWATILYNSTTFPLTNAIATSSNTATSIGITINGNTASSNVSGTGYTLSTCSTWNISWNTATVSEIILYNSILSVDQRQQVEKYLAWKWKVPSKLPTTHIGYKGPPVTFGKVPYYTAFSPLSIPTCALWLDAADSTTVTGTTTVTAWSDKSGNGRPVTITSAPSYGTTTQNKLKTLAFNNNQVTTSIASAVGTGDFTLIAVWYQSTGGTNTVLSLGTSGSSSQSLGYSATKYNFYQFGSVQESAYTTSAGSWVIQIGTRISSVKTVYINGYPGTTPSTDSYNQTVTTVTIGKGDGFGITGQIGEILVYTGTMAQTDLQKIESYLAQKWNLTAQLPLTHLNTTKPAGLPAAVPQVLLLFTALNIVNLGSYTKGSTVIRSTTGQYYTITVPGGAKYMLITMWGAAGAGRGGESGGQGNGAYISGVLKITTGAQYRAIVGKGGSFNHDAADYPYYGGGGVGNWSLYGPGGDGGGRSAIQMLSNSTWVDVATAGGGGGSAGDGNTGEYGRAGAASAFGAGWQGGPHYAGGSNAVKTTSRNGTGGSGGGGGTSSGGEAGLYGASTYATAGSLSQGGNAGYAGGAGGGGYYGGGGGVGDGNVAGAGGGGSSYTALLANLVGYDGTDSNISTPTLYVSGHGVTTAGGGDSLDGIVYYTFYS